MKTFKHALTLALAAGLLSACGGGGGSNSPDRPGLRLDPETLRIEFPNGNILAATGNAMIQARMLALQTDGIEDNQTPELNVTADTSWSITGDDNDPVVAAVADEVRDAGSLGDVIDILSTVRLTTADTTKSLALAGSYSFSGETYNLSSPFTVRPPIPNGPAFISGPGAIALDPLNNVVPDDVAYQLLQPLKEIPTPENQTDTVRFCSDSDFLLFNGDQPYTQGSAPATIINPFFDNDDNQTVVVTVQVIDPDFDCDEIGETQIGGTDENPIFLSPDYTKTVQLIPAVVQAGGVTVCGIINPEVDACGTDGTFNDASYLSDCRGLNSSSIDVPAGENLQMVARLNYTNPSNGNQPAFTDYRCAASGRLTWSASGDPIFANGLDQDNGSGSLISRSEFLDIADSNPNSDVTGSFDNNNGSPAITDSLTLNLVDSTVSDIEIVPIDPDPNAPNTIFLNILQEDLDYRAQCTFGESSPVTATCADACVSWSVEDEDLLTVNPETGSTTTVSSADGSTVGSADLIATYTCAPGINDTQEVTTVDDPVVELHLLQVSNANEDPEVRNVDAFSCVGRTDLVGTLADGETFINGSQQFYAHALFQSDADLLSDEERANLDPSTLPDVSGADAVVFSSLPGYANGDGSCATALGLELPDVPGSGGDGDGSLLSGIPILGGLLDFYLGDVIDILTIPLDSLPGLPGGGDGGFGAGPAASFSGEMKGRLQANGQLRLSTVCIQSFIDNDGSGGLTDGDDLAQESSSVLVLPAADDNLLNFSNELCEILEPALTLGAGTPASGFVPAGVVVPLVYGVSLIADPVLNVLDDTVPTEDILNALITGSFSDLSIPGQPEFTDAPFGLGFLTGGLLGGTGATPGLEPTLVDTLDSCLVDPLTLSVNSLLTGLLTLDPGELANIADSGFSPADCADLFGGLLPGDGIGLPDLPGAPGIPLPLPTP